MTTQLLSQGFAPAFITVEDRYKYSMALSQGDEGDLKNIAQMLCESVRRGYEMLLS